jgi:ribosomal protein S18 acetylase RimI-like enzyme
VAPVFIFVAGRAPHRRLLLGSGIGPHQRPLTIVVRIAAYQATDAHELVRMWRASFEHGVGITDPNPIEDQFQFFVRDVVPRNTVRVVRDQGAIVAFLASKPESISHLYVGVHHLGRGIGTELLSLAKAESPGSLWLYTFAQNRNARRFYERHGFEEVERECENMFKLEAIKYAWLRGASAA